MGSVTPTVVPGDAYVRVEANWQDIAHNRRVWIYRTQAGIDTKLRDGDYAWLSNGLAVAFDHEAPLDTPVSYKSTIPLNYNGDFEAGVTEWQDTTNSGTVGTVAGSTDYFVPGTGNASARLTPSGAATSKAVSEIVPITADAVNANPYFETNSSDWSGLGGAAVSRTTAQFHQGVAGLLIAPNGAGSGAGAQTSEYVAVPGVTYGYSGWLRLSSGSTLSRDIGIAFYDSSHVLIGSASVQTQSPAATVWTFYSGTAVAPGGTAFMRLITQGPGVLASGNNWIVDQMLLTDPTTQRQYTISGQLLLASYWTGGIGVQLQWYSGTTLIGSTGALSDVTPSVGVWAPYGFTGVSLPGADGVRLVFGITGTAPTTTLLYGDEMYLFSTATTVTSGPVIVPSAGGGWWTDPLHPATKVKLQIDLSAANCQGFTGVAYLGVGPDKTRRADGAAFDVNNAPYPVGAFAVRKAPRSTMRTATPTLADLARVQGLHASGAPLLLQMDARYGEPDQYQLHGDLSEGRVNGDQREQWRVLASDFTEVLPPIGPADGTLRARYVDLTKYTTFAAATSAGATWLDGLRGLLTI